MTDDIQHDHDYKVGVNNSGPGWFRIVHYALSQVIILKVRSKIATIVHIKCVTEILLIINSFLRVISWTLNIPYAKMTFHLLCTDSSELNISPNERLKPSERLQRSGPQQMILHT